MLYINQHAYIIVYWVYCVDYTVRWSEENTSLITNISWPDCSYQKANIEASMSFSQFVPWTHGGPKMTCSWVQTSYFQGKLNAALLLKTYNWKAWMPSVCWNAVSLWQYSHFSTLTQSVLEAYLNNQKTLCTMDLYKSHKTHRLWTAMGNQLAHQPAFQMKRSGKCLGAMWSLMGGLRTDETSY